MTNLAAWKVILTSPTPSLETIQLPSTINTLNKLSAILPNGAYTTLRTYHKSMVPMLSRHFDRLDETASLEGFTSARLNRDAIRHSLRLALREFKQGEVRIRLTMDLKKKPGDIYIAVEKLPVPSMHDYETGVKVVTRMMQRNNPKAKLTEFISSADLARQEIEVGINEVLMIDPNRKILEGLSSNFFAVLEGELWTAEQDVLSGITRSIVLKAAGSAGIIVHYVPVNMNQLLVLREAFITSASRGVLPIKSIDGIPIGTIVPGPLTARIDQGYQQALDLMLEEI